jgi:3-oxoacyl-[acyl-carrier protein] reductase
MQTSCCLDHKQNFIDQVVIVTGASRGIGRGIAKHFAQEGAQVVLVGRDEEQLKTVKKELEELKGKATYIVGDVCKEEDMKAMADKVMKSFGRIDILAHNAGIYPCVRLEKMTKAEWDKVITTNLTGTFLAITACIPKMIEQKHGKIVITSSISGPQTALPGFSHYTASKGGVAGFVKTAAVELAKYQINVNAVEPGNVMTEGLEATGEEHINNMTRAVPLGRLGTPEDIANAVLFLASNKASYITGQSLIVDGGTVLPESHFDPY